MKPLPLLNVPAMIATPFAVAGTLLALWVIAPQRAGAQPGASEPAAATLSATLTGAAEVPPGDPNATGTFSATLNDTHDQLCYELTVTRADTPTAAHIHEGVAGKAGSPVVPLQAPASGIAKACATVTAELAIRLTQHPENYYVNVHNAAFPTGAVRGQLTR